MKKGIILDHLVVVGSASGGLVDIVNCWRIGGAWSSQVWWERMVARGLCMYVFACLSFYCVCVCVCVCVC